MPNIEKLRAKNEALRLKYQNTLLKKRLKFVAQYDAVRETRERRQPQKETSGEDGVYSPRDRVLGSNFLRDLERNYAPARGIIYQFRMNVVGSQGKIQLNTDGGDEAAEWFNSVWAKNCEFRDGLHFSVVLQNIVAAVLREGDLLAVLDDGLINDTGKLVFWESDQIVPLSEEQLPAEYRGYTQENGVLRGKWGEVVAYISTGKRGLTILDKLEDATIWKKENAVLIKNPWRLNQGRGVPSLITSATNFLDLYEILGAELLSAKRAAIIAGFTKRKNAEMNWDAPGSAPEFLPENSGKTKETVAEESSGGGGAEARNYENFERLTGGMWEYIDSDDEITFPDINRPNVQLSPFIEAVLGYAGASVGLARAYSLLRADSSYTSFRGDMILSWASAFYPMQKWLERCFADWVAIKALSWAERKREIKKLPADWKKKISWVWPTMPSVDEGRESVAEAQWLKNGTIDYGKILGPDWKKKLKALSEQLEFARQINLPLSVFEQKSGGAAPSETKEKENTDE